MKEGNSILCNLTGFLHYFYIPAPVGFREETIREFTSYLQEIFTRQIHHVELVLKESIWGYNGNVKSPFLKIVVTDPRAIAKVRGGFERGEVVFQNYFTGSPMTSYDNITYVLRAMVDCHVSINNCFF